MKLPAVIPSPCPHPGFVESFAFGGEAPKKQQGGEGIPVGEPSAPWALPYAVGTSYLAGDWGATEEPAMGFS